MPRKATKELLLHSALTLFAERGYADTTVAEICEHAGANIAGVSYHFGGKDELFRAALLQALHLAETAHPISEEGASDSAPEKQLAWFMEAMIQRCFARGPAGQFDRIMSHEGAREDAPKEVIMEQVEAHGIFLNKILQKLLNTRSQKLLFQARANVMALCVFPGVVRGVGRMLFPKPPTPSALSRYIERQTAFALQGIKALANQKS